jgi:hypothetical protein
MRVRGRFSVRKFSHVTPPRTKTFALSVRILAK